MGAVATERQAVAWQGNLFGPPEAVGADEEGRRRDDAPVPCERELLWPADLARDLGPELLERLYGDIPRRTRLNMPEVCRRLRCAHTHVYDLIACGSLDATDDSVPTAQRPNYGIYRYSLVSWLFHREFVARQTRCGMPSEDLERCLAAAERRRRERRMRP